MLGNVCAIYNEYYKFVGVGKVVAHHEYAKDTISYYDVEVHCDHDFRLFVGGPETIEVPVSLSHSRLVPLKYMPTTKSTIAVYHNREKEDFQLGAVAGYRAVDVYCPIITKNSIWKGFSSVIKEYIYSLVKNVETGQVTFENFGEEESFVLGYDEFTRRYPTLVYRA